MAKAVRTTGTSKHSTRRLLNRAIFLLPVTLLLSGCPAEWSISKVLVNPQPLAGNETVLPVAMVAPETGSVAVTVLFERNKNFTDPLVLSLALHYNDPEDHRRLYSRIGYSTVASDRGVVIAFRASCHRVGESAKLRLANENNLFGVEVSGIIQAEIALEIEAVSYNPRSDRYVTANAAKPLQVSCRADGLS